ncbi:hypothetical protein VTH82DRAFT_6764 [Thermothelomyces myriococcoides]
MMGEWIKDHSPMVDEWDDDDLFDDTEQPDEDALAALFEEATPTSTAVVFGNIPSPSLDSDAHEDSVSTPTTAPSSTASIQDKEDEVPSQTVPTIAAAKEAVAAIDNYEARRAALSQMIAAAKAADTANTTNSINTVNNNKTSAPNPTPTAATTTTTKIKRSKQRPKKPILLDKRGLPVDKKARRAELRRREQARPRTAAERQATHATAHLFASTPLRATAPRRDKRKAWIVEAEEAATAAAAAARGGWLEQGGERILQGRPLPPPPPPKSRPSTSADTDPAATDDTDACAWAAAANSNATPASALTSTLAREKDQHRAKRQATLREMRSRGVEIVSLVDDGD